MEGYQEGILFFLMQENHETKTEVFDDNEFSIFSENMAFNEKASND